ncbi:hypothetical protein QTP70_034844 [Hemibagrus guttatus]|uniref:ribonuclease H n=1 Tax=Hemibagrus guttatus TaxID=175788 RepID=A0AAE0PTJ4_9TELE|nr:hypothetical protein QTP70_034844 [Hemibagrus guttatus]
METGRKVLGVSSGRRKADKETWWWNEEVRDSVQRKRLARKKWDMDRTEENRQEYKELQHRVKREVSKAKQKAYDELYTRLDKRRREGLVQIVDKIRKDEVRKALKRMKSGKAVGPDDIPVEVWKFLGEAAVEFLTSFFNRVLESERMPEEWRRSVFVPIFKNKGDVQSCSNYRGIKLMSHTMKLWERVVEARLRKVVEILMDQLSEEVRQESPWTMMFADDIVICSESREQVGENLERWGFTLERRGMKVSRSKTEYMGVNEREGSRTVRLQGEEVKKVQEFKYLGSTVQSNGEWGKEVKKQVQAEVLIEPSCFVFSFIHCLPLIRSILRSRGACAYLRRHWASRQDTPWTECQPIWHSGTHTLSITHYRQFRDTSQPTMHVFGPGGGNRSTRKKPPRHRDNMQTPHTRRRRESNPQPWRCEAKVLTTKPHFCIS